jgi:hypothetical protein
VNDTTKRCAACGEPKPRSDFHKDSRKPDGKRSRCKACTNSGQRAFQRDHKARTGRYSTAKYRYECTCVTCGTTWQAARSGMRYCSVACANTARSYERTCNSCGETFTAKLASACWCSDTCRARGRPPGAALIIWKPQPWWAKRVWVLSLPQPRRWYAGQCRRCTTAFISDQPENRYCSRPCLRADAKARRRALKKNAYVADVSRTRIFERDKWICQLCYRKVNKAAVVPHPKAPVLDHIIPLDDGGTHEPANVQCAHFLCNSTKGARGGGEQLLLIG